MKVIATKLGHYGNKLVEVGEVFELKNVSGKVINPMTGRLIESIITAESQFSDKWMKKLDEYEVVSEELNSVPKKKGRPFSKKVEGDSLEVI